MRRRVLDDGDSVLDRPCPYAEFLGGFLLVRPEPSPSRDIARSWPPIFVAYLTLVSPSLAMK
jgi:hypothetical protein